MFRTLLARMYYKPYNNHMDPTTPPAAHAKPEPEQRGDIVAEPSWCSDCITNATPCVHHSDTDGNPKVYAGPDLYKPSAWVLEIVGRRYRSARGVVFCFGYDPRHGFWMRQVAAPFERHNVSERAINRSFHPIALTPGAHELARLIAKLGRIPTADECRGRVVLSLASKS